MDLKIRNTYRMSPTAVAVLNTRSVEGEVLFTQRKGGIYIEADFKKLPSGLHGFHIHKGGDLRGEGCKMACDHFHVGLPQNHGGPPGKRAKDILVTWEMFLLEDILIC